MPINYRYFLALAAFAPVLLVAVHDGGRLIARVVVVAGLAGLLAYVVLLVANLMLFATAIWESVRGTPEARES